MIIKAIIIDDQKRAIDSLKDDLQTYYPDNIQILGESQTIDEAVVLFKEYTPDLIFLDIDLKNNITGFDFLERINVLEHKNYNVIFTTAFNQFAIKAIRFSAFDYLLKPINSSDLKQAIDRLIVSGLISNDNEAGIEVLIHNNSNLNKRIVINLENRVEYLFLDNIIRLESTNNYTTIYTKNDKLLTSKTIKSYEDLLGDLSFVRIHRSHIVNLNYVRSFLKGKNSYVCLNDGTEIPVSLRKKEQIINALSEFIK